MSDDDFFVGIEINPDWKSEIKFASACESNARLNLNQIASGKTGAVQNQRDIEDIDCADVLSIYLSNIGEPADQFEIISRIGRLNEFWGGKMLSAINAKKQRH